LRKLLADNIQLPPGAQTIRANPSHWFLVSRAPESATRRCSTEFARASCSLASMFGLTVPSVLLALQLEVTNSRPTTPAGLRRRSMPPVRWWSKVLSSSPRDCLQYAASCGQEFF